jgi:hypothetical protein
MENRSFKRSGFFLPKGDGLGCAPELQLTGKKLTDYNKFIGIRDGGS